MFLAWISIIGIRAGFIVESCLTIEIKWVGGCYQLNNLMNDILVSRVWQEALKVKYEKLKSIEILDGESRQMIQGSWKW